MGLTTNNHSVFNLQYRLIIVVKGNQEVLTNEISDRFEEMFSEIGKNNHISVIKWSAAASYIIVDFSAHPKTELSKFVNSFKSASSRKVKKEFPHIKNLLSDEHFWSKGYCLFTSGVVDDKEIEAYIATEDKNK